SRSLYAADTPTGQASPGEQDTSQIQSLQGPTTSASAGQAVQGEQQSVNPSGSHASRVFHEVRHGSPTNIASILKELFGGKITVSADNNSGTVIVIGSEKMQEEVRLLILDIDTRTEDRIQEDHKKNEVERAKRSDATTAESAPGQSQSGNDSRFQG